MSRAGPKKAIGRRYLQGVAGIAAHDDTLFISERAWLAQDRIGHTQLADVVQRAPRRMWTRSASPRPMVCGRASVISVTRLLCPSVSWSRRSKARGQPSIVES